MLNDEAGTTILGRIKITIMKMIIIVSIVFIRRKINNNETPSYPQLCQMHQRWGTLVGSSTEDLEAYLETHVDAITKAINVICNK